MYLNIRTFGLRQRQNAVQQRIWDRLTLNLGRVVRDGLQNEGVHGTEILIGVIR